MKKKIHNDVSKLTILCWAAFIAILDCMRPTGHGLDTPLSFVQFCTGVSQIGTYVLCLHGAQWSGEGNIKQANK